jgi:glycerate 2-kinase
MDEPMRILIAPAAFKHSLSAERVAEAIGVGLTRSTLQCTLQYIPIADGGNGTLNAFLTKGGQKLAQTVTGPLGQPVTAAYGILADGRTAVIEMALASGLELVPDDALDPLRASTYGTGELMRAALDSGAARFIVGMGGSATVDGGAGCLQALGVRLLDERGVEVPPGGGNLHRIHTIDTRGLDPRWRGAEVIVASDVDNLALGEQGAAAVFGPQKGAGPRDVETLEANLRHFFTVVATRLGVDVRETPGGGAAGALSAGLMAFLGGRIQFGIDLILEYHGFDDLLRGADLVVTGEGQMDRQTVHGKGPIGVARRAREHGVPTVAIVGGLNTDDALLHEAGIAADVPIVTRPMSLDDAIADAASLVERAGLRLGYLLALSGGQPRPG